MQNKIVPDTCQQTIHVKQVFSSTTDPGTTTQNFDQRR